jgi:RNA polymerase sigma factor (TIGR02999 family)
MEAAAGDTEPDDRTRDADALFRELYVELKGLASGFMRRQRSEHTLQVTALVHEAWLRLQGEQPGHWHSPHQLMTVAARAMRSILVDHARARSSLRRRAPGARVPLDGLLDRVEAQDVDLVDLDAALVRLEADGPLGARAVRVIELRYFCGLAMAEVAEALEIALRTAERDFLFARDWLRRQLA